MGAGQSAESGKRPVQEIKTSYYELLEIDRTATDDDIKKAYRRKALSLHPDRNYGKEEDATKLFAAVQSAYEVLSDPQERAWYDSHEEAILRDIDPTAAANEDGVTAYETSVGLTSADDVTRLIRRFHGGINFDDSPNGFFGFLRETFDQLAKEEEQAARRQGDDVRDYPSFGHKEDTHEDGVRQFYGAWAGFSTVKSFAWRDKYRMSDAEDRRMRRLIDKENMRFRKEGMQEFNDAVRSLVAFVRRRDPRYKQNTQTEAERQKVLQDASKAQAARMREANEKKMQGENAVPEWAQRREPAEADGKGVEEGTFDESSSEEEHFECMACRKTFKSEKQYEAHEKSNKHKKAVQALRRKLQKEGHRVGLEEDDIVQEEEDLDRSPITSPAREEVSKDFLSAVHEGLEEDLDSVNDKMQQARLDDDQVEASVDSKDHHPVESDEETKIAEEWSIDSGSTLTPSEPAPPKKGKAAQKREKKAAKIEAAEAEELKHRCAVCGSAFSSKTQLFQHLKDLKHAAPIPQGKYKQPNTASKKKKKG